MIVWISKYAITLGIFAQDVVVDPSDSERVRVPGFRNTFGPGEWHATRLEATNKATLMRQEALSQLQARVDEVTALKLE